MSRLNEIKARADAATEGPWVRDMHSPDMSGRSGWYIRGPRKLGLRSMVLNSRMLSGDAEFIAAAREDVPWLLAVVESGQRMIEALTDELMSKAAKVERLTAEREWFKDRFPCDGVCVDAPEEACSRHGRNPADLWRIIGEVTAERDAQTKRAERLERWYADALTMLDKSRRWKSIASLTAERDALAARLALVEALAEEWRYKGQFGWGPWQIGEGPDPEGYVMDHCASALRDALAGSEADTSDTQPTDQEVSDE